MIKDSKDKIIKLENDEKDSDSQIRKRLDELKLIVNPKNETTENVATRLRKGKNNELKIEVYKT